MNNRAVIINKVVQHELYNIKTFLNGIIDDYPELTDDNTESYYEESAMHDRLEKFLSDIDSILYDLKSYSSPSKEDILVYNKSKNNFKLKKENKNIFSGQLVELYNEDIDEWEPGKIEYSKNYNGYYFLSFDACPKELKNNMKIRIKYVQ
jgi:hypothetical protein